MKTKIAIPMIIMSMALSFVACQSEEASSIDESLLNQQDYPSQYKLTDEQEAQADALAVRFPDKDKRLIRLAVRLSLSDEQIEQVAPILDGIHEQLMAFHDKMKALKDSGNRPSREEMKAFGDEIKAIHDSAEEQIKALLTDEQKTTFDALIAEVKKMRQEQCEKRGESGGNRRPPRGCGPPPMR